MQLARTIARIASPGPKINLVRACAAEAARRDATEIEQSAESKQLIRELQRAKALQPA